MPTYEYECRNCHHKFELYQSITAKPITRCPKCKKAMKRIPEVLDCWFESGSMPYAQAHYPFENKAHFDAHFPADFIAEGLDQTRGWFYTLMVLSVSISLSNMAAARPACLEYSRSFPFSSCR